MRFSSFLKVGCPTKSVLYKGGGGLLKQNQTEYNLFTRIESPILPSSKV
ncbi:hypothetical protein PORCAN_186 [Porphyromonas crevioricanis JCM 13913]|nr:hypothetical protein PORCAN_186 [Porphyromonas crevioricanis JCM 13913]